MLSADAPPAPPLALHPLPPLARAPPLRRAGPRVNTDLGSLLVAFGLGGGLAFAGSVPMTGPLALLVLDRILAAQRRAALWISLAGALVEGTIAAGVALLLPLVLRHSEAIVLRARLSGAFVIFAVGVTLAIRPDLLRSIKTDRKRQSFAVGFLTTALNPTLLATWTVTVTTLHTNGLMGSGSGPWLVFGLGVAAGALGWFVLLLLLARRAQRRPQSAGVMARLRQRRGAIERGIGVVLALLGAALFTRAVWADG
jgi:threonine/homoserine/homoserine lactone efflux protein